MTARKGIIIAEWNDQNEKRRHNSHNGDEVASKKTHLSTKCKIETLKCRNNYEDEQIEKWLKPNEKKKN